MQKLKFYYQKFIQNATFYFQAYIVAYQVLKKRKLGSILQMLLMEFHLLIEQSQKWKENGSTWSLTAKNELVHFEKNRIQTGGGPPSSSSISTCDERIISIIGETSLSGIIPDGDSDDTPLQESTSAQSDGKATFHNFLGASWHGKKKKNLEEIHKAVYIWADFTFL